MAYQEKYNYTFIPTGLSEVHLVEIWQDTADVLVAEEVTAGLPPFVVQLPDMKNKFQAVRGTGCIINLLSDTDQKFFNGLYHVNPKEFMVKHYIDGVLNWVGYLNPEMYSEPYDQLVNYTIQTTGNDGFNLMDRLFFNETDATQYQGMKSKWALLQIIFDKIGLPYTDIRISLSTTFADFTGAANSTILHESYVDSANFYDEDQKPMTLRGVVESILKPYGAFIKQSEGSVYISDINTMAAGGSVTYQKFNATTYAYVSDVVVVNEKSVASIGYLGTGQQKEMSGGINRQTVTYSPYPSKIITDELLVRPEEFTTVPGSFSAKDGYIYRTLADHSFYKADTPADFEESASSASTEHFVYFRMPRETGGSSIPQLEFISATSLYLNVLSSASSNVISISGTRKRYLDGVAILLTGKVLTKTKDNPYTGYSTAEKDADKDKAEFLTLTYIAAIGEGLTVNYYQQSTQTWVTTAVVAGTINIQNTGGETISNKWTEFSHLMPMNLAAGQAIIAGNFIIIIGSDTYMRITGGELVKNNAILQEVWLGDLKISLVNKDGSELSDKDIEYIGELDKTFLNEGEKVELTTGTASQFADRGKICWNDGTYYKVIDEWTRAAQTYKIEELLLGSISSNYMAGYISLLNMNLKNSFTTMNVITDTYSAGKIFMVNSISTDYYNNVSTTKLVEIKADELIIVKE